MRLLGVFFILSAILFAWLADRAAHGDSAKAPEDRPIPHWNGETPAFFEDLNTRQVLLVKNAGKAPTYVNSCPADMAVQMDATGEGGVGDGNVRCVLTTNTLGEGGR